MKTISKYLKPFAATILAAVVLLFFQAYFDLKLPDYMSNIVTVGLQQGGVTDASPSAISTEGMAFITSFMSAEDQKTVSQYYSLVSPESATAQQKEAYPLLSQKSVYLLQTEKSDARTVLNPIFENASYSFVSLAQSMQTASGSTTQGTEELSTFSDLTKLYAMTPRLQQIPAAQMDAARAAAAATPQTSKASVAAAFAKSYYNELGMDTNKIQSSYIWHTGILMLLMSALSVVASIAVGFCAARVGAGFARSLRRGLFHRVESFSSEEFDHFSTASLITRTTNDVTQMQQVTTMAIRMLASAPIMAIGGIIMAWRKSPSMSWLIALAALLIICMIMVLFAAAMPKFKIMQKLVDKLNLVMRESLSGMLVIRAFGTQDFEEQKFDNANTTLTSNNLFVSRAVGLMMPFMSLVMNGLTLLIVWIGAKQIAASALQVGDMMAFMQYAMQIIMNFFMISMMFIMLPRASVSAGRIAEVLETTPTIRDSEAPAPLSASFVPSVSFENVSFKYPEAEEYALENISFTARPGETTAFIGSTGSGKSTLVNLVPRFYDVSEGSVLVNGVDVRNYTQHDLRSKIGYVPQKGNLFSGDISSNLRYGREEATLEELKTASEIAQATEFIDALPDAYDTPISQGGSNVSGGQRQRLSIARALVTNASIYIFDDSFSALDFKTDAALRRALRSEITGATILLVAQRISTIMNAQQIIVLDDGKIVGKGTHEELMKNCETYREIALSQLSEEELA